MPIKLIWCPVLGDDVLVVTDLDGAVTRIICAEYDADETCRLKKSASAGIGHIHDDSRRGRNACMFRPA